MAFSKNLFTLLEKTGTSDYRLGKILHVHPTTVRNWKVGRSVPSADKVKEVARYFGKTVDDLLN